jgi:tetratricopeptide (TPR) repeat protein
MTPSDSFDQLLRRAQRAQAKGKLPPAQKSLLAAAQRLLNSSMKSPDERIMMFDALAALAKQLHAAGDEPNHRLVCSTAKSFVPATSAESADATAFVLLGSAQFQAHQPNPAEAESQFQKALTHAEEWCAPEIVDQARYQYARFLYQKRQFRRAVTILAALTKSKSQASAESSVAAETQKLYAACLTELRSYELAMSAYRQAIKILGNGGRKNDSARLQTYCEMARVMRLSEQIQTAQTYLREASELSADTDQPGKTRLLCEEAAIAYCQSRFDIAINRYEAAVERMHEYGLDSTREYADALVGLAMSYFSAHRSKPVEALLISSLRIMRKTLGPRSFEGAAVLNKLAGVYKQHGRFVESSVLLSGVEAIQGKAHLMDRFVDSSRNFSAGLNFQMDGHYVLALNRYKRALRALEKLDENKSFDSIAIHIRMYEIYLAVGDETRADSHYETAAHLLTNVFGYQTPNPFRSAMTLAACFDIQDKDDMAESFFLYALAVARREGTTDRGLEACEEYAAMLERTGREAEAKQLRRWANPSRLARLTVRGPGTKQ